MAATCSLGDMVACIRACKYDDHPILATEFCEVLKAAHERVDSDETRREGPMIDQALFLMGEIGKTEADAAGMASQLYGHPLAQTQSFAGLHNSARFSLRTLYHFRQYRLPAMAPCFACRRRVVVLLRVLRHMQTWPRPLQHVQLLSAV